MIEWEPYQFSVDQVGTGLVTYECAGLIAAVYVPQPITSFWTCLHLPSSQLIGFRHDTLAECKKAAEHLMSTDIDWDAPSIAAVIANNNLTEETVDCLLIAALENFYEPVSKSVRRVVPVDWWCQDILSATFSYQG